MNNKEKEVIIELIIKAYCEIENFNYDNLSSDAYDKMYYMCYKLDDLMLITRLYELYQILFK